MQNLKIMALLGVYLTAGLGFGTDSRPEIPGLIRVWAPGAPGNSLVVNFCPGIFVQYISVERGDLIKKAMFNGPDTKPVDISLIVSKLRSQKKEAQEYFCCGSPTCDKLGEIICSRCKFVRYRTSAN